MARNSTSFRLITGGRIDRSKVISFSFNNKIQTGFQGDTLASALLANGVDTLSRSFKYHRRRGLQNHAYADVSSLVQLRGDYESPNVLASVQPLYAGLKAQSVNCWPNVEFDLASLLSVFSNMIPAGFYYKTFMRPHWHIYEPSIRKMAGFGTAPQCKTEAHFESCFGHCDILIVGAGPAGLMAALTAARSNANVFLIDEMPEAGGSLSFSTEQIDDLEAFEWVKRGAGELQNCSNVTYLANATCWGYHEGNMLTVLERIDANCARTFRNWKIWAKQVIIATGAIERPIVFENNDLPGVMTSSAIRNYIHQFGVAPGKSAILFVNNDRAYQTLLSLNWSGIRIKAVVDVRSSVDPKLHELVSDCDTQLLLGHTIKKALKGKTRTRGAVVSLRDNLSKSIKIACDFIGVSGGWNPAVHLFSQSRGSVLYDDQLQTFVLGQAAQTTKAAGQVTGVSGLEQILNDGVGASASALADLGKRILKFKTPIVVQEHQAGSHIEAYWSSDWGDKPSKAFVDFAGDVTVFDIKLALQEGYSEIEHLKRYSTIGMGLDQGKTANVNAIGIVSKFLDCHPSEVGVTTFRPPYTPVEFGAIAGTRQGYEVLPYRHTPMTKWHIEHGAVMHEAGARWNRPAYYPQTGETMRDAIYRECRAVRNGVGMYDGSPLGKFEIKGADSTKLLNLLYTNDFSRLSLNQGRYGMMMNEAAIVIDDGVVFRLGSERFLMFCSTGTAPAIERKLEQLINIEQPELEVIVTPVTEQWANATVCGPQAREVLGVADSDIDFASGSFPFMALKEGRIENIPVRVFRVSFTGELSFEVNAPARFGLAIWQYLMELGAKWDICPVGSEANHVLRVEKGFLSMAHEVDGTVDPVDLGRKSLIDFKKRDFVGKRSMEIRRKQNPVRLELVGLLPKDSNQLIAEGAPIVKIQESKKSEGFVSACVWSDTCECVIALGLLERGRARMGESITVWEGDKPVRAEVTEPIFYDPAGKRLRM